MSHRAYLCKSGAEVRDLESADRHLSQHILHKAWHRCLTLTSATHLTHSRAAGLCLSFLQEALFTLVAMQALHRVPGVQFESAPWKYLHTTLWEQCHHLVNNFDSTKILLSKFKLDLSPVRAICFSPTLSCWTSTNLETTIWLINGKIKQKTKAPQ